MRSAGFGRRVIEPGGRELVLNPGQEAPGPAPDPVNRDELKEQIRAALMSRIDPSVAGRIPRARLRAEVASLVSEIANEQRIQLNEIEESALAGDSKRGAQARASVEGRGYSGGSRQVAGNCLSFAD